MTNREITDIYDGLYYLRENASQPFSARVAYAITRDLRILQPIVEDINTTREQILAKYGTLQEDGNYLVLQENVSAAQENMDNLGAIDVDIDLMPINLKDIEHLNLSVKEMDALYPIVRWEEG